MPTYELTQERAEAYAQVFDFRTSIVRAARQIMDTYGIEAVGPGDGVSKLPRYFTSVDAQRGAATGRRSPVALGGRRYQEYCEFFCTLVIMNVVPVETAAKAAGAYLTEEHVRELDRLTSLEDAIFMEHLTPFSEELCPLHEVTEILPMDPDERPVESREANVAYRRWRLKVNVRYGAWPSS